MQLHVKHRTRVLGIVRVG